MIAEKAGGVRIERNTIGMSKKTVAALDELAGMLRRRHGHALLGRPFALAQAITGEVARRQAGDQPDLTAYQPPEDMHRETVRLTPEVWAWLDYMAEEDARNLGGHPSPRSLTAQIIIPRELAAYRRSLAKINLVGEKG